MFCNRTGSAVRSLSATVALALSVFTLSPAHGQSWSSLGHDSQHSGQSAVGSQLPQKVIWQTPVDLAPQYSGSDLLIHYGSPLVTNANTILIPVKTGAADGFQIQARSGANGFLLWAQTTDYTLPPHNWTPSYGPALAPNGRLYYAGAGGTVYYRSNLDAPGAVSPTQVAFFGNVNYHANPAAFNNSIQICTPITCDSNGNVFFGYLSSGVALPGYPLGIPSGIARIDPNGGATFTSATSASANAQNLRVVTNCAPAVTSDGATVYIATTSGNFSSGCLCALDGTTLARKASVLLMDPRPGVGTALLPDDGSASPTIGPDGDVYFGVLEGNFPSNHDRGWLLHFNGSLSMTRTPGAFGWDDTASIVPASAVPSYAGASAYLIMSKYNNYAGVGGDGHNKLAILDPNATETDPITGAFVMNEVLTVLGPTPDPEFGGSAVREWCINCAAVDVVNKCCIVNSEDGHVYRWDLVTNSLSPAFPMAAATGEAYTPTVIGADGKVYAINNATLFAVGDNRQTLFNVSAQVSVTRSGFLIQRSNGQYYQTITLTNNSGSTIDGPFSLVLDNLANGTLANATGSTSALTPAGRPYINAPVGSLGPGANTQFQVFFARTGPTITYSTEVWAGPGAR